MLVVRDAGSMLWTADAPGKVMLLNWHFHDTNPVDIHEVSVLADVDRLSCCANEFQREVFAAVLRHIISVEQLDILGPMGRDSNAAVLDLVNRMRT